MAELAARRCSSVPTDKPILLINKIENSGILGMNVKLESNYFDNMFKFLYEREGDNIKLIIIYRNHPEYEYFIRNGDISSAHHNIQQFVRVYNLSISELKKDEANRRALIFLTNEKIDTTVKNLSATNIHKLFTNKTFCFYDTYGHDDFVFVHTYEHYRITKENMDKIQLGLIEEYDIATDYKIKNTSSCVIS